MSGELSEAREIIANQTEEIEQKDKVISEQKQIIEELTLKLKEKEAKLKYQEETLNLQQNELQLSKNLIKSKENELFKANQKIANFNQIANKFIRQYQKSNYEDNYTFSFTETPSTMNTKVRESQSLEGFSDIKKKLNDSPINEENLKIDDN